MTTIRQMLDRNSIPEPNTGCWLWLRGVSNGGYPVWKWENRPRQVTHLALTLKGIEIQRGFDACHTCDNPYCVNPDHLFVGTRADNMRDAQAKGRLVGYGKREACKYGHPLSGDNLYVHPASGKRHCRTCDRRRERERYWRVPERRHRKR